MSLDREFFWKRHQRILRLQREHSHELNEEGRRLLERCVISTFDAWRDVAREDQGVAV